MRVPSATNHPRAGVVRSLRTRSDTLTALVGECAFQPNVVVTQQSAITEIRAVDEAVTATVRHRNVIAMSEGTTDQNEEPNGQADRPGSCNTSGDDPKRDGSVDAWPTEP